MLNSLYKDEIYPGVHYIDNTQYDPYKYAYGSCPFAHAASDQLITLPIHCNLSNKDINKVIKNVKEFK
jgi:dTDP-4-amino-4,6-dideoxygalactose transaminase